MMGSTPTPRERNLVRSVRSLGRVPRPRGESWAMIGQDGGQSVSWGSRTLFVFSDTLLAAARPVAPGKFHRLPFAVPLEEQGYFLANCAAVGEGENFLATLSELRFFEDEEGFPRQILEATAEEDGEEIRFWPEHGIEVDGEIYLYYLGIQTTDPTQILGFRNLGTGLARLDPTTGLCRRLSPGGDWRFFLPQGDDAHFGVQVLRQGDHLYVYGSVRDRLEVSARLVRVAVDRLTEPEAYELLVEGGEAPAWSPDLHHGLSLGPASTEFSVTYNPYLDAYLMLYLDAFSKDLLLRTAAAPWGPFSEPRRVTAVPHHPSAELVYLGFEHPGFRRRDGRTVYLTYCQPRFLSNSVLALTFR